MPSYQENANDLAKKYEHSYVRYKGIITYMSHFQGNEDRIVALVSTKKEQKRVLEVVDENAIEPLTFDAMFVNNYGEDKTRVPGTLFERSPRRQWRRGLNQENCRISCPLSRLYSIFGKRLYGFDNTLSFPLLEHLSNPTYPSVKETYKTINGQQAIAISPMFILTLSSVSNDKYLIASRFGFIGEAYKDTFYIYHRPALQEVRDFITRTKQPISVESVNA